MKDIRIGHGFDVHRFGAAQPLRLGGVEIPSSRGGLQGHSDADVVLPIRARNVRIVFCAGVFHYRVFLLFLAYIRRFIIIVALRARV